MTLWHHWGASQGVSDAPHDGGSDGCPRDWGAVTDTPCDCKTTLNIDIYPSTLAVLKILAISMILRGGTW